MRGDARGDDGTLPLPSLMAAKVLGVASQASIWYLARSTSAVRGSVNAEAAAAADDDDPQVRRQHGAASPNPAPPSLSSSLLLKS